MDDTSNPTAEQTAAAQDSANSLIASSVAEMVVLIEGTDLLTLKLALQAEQAKGASARKGAVAALQTAIDGHPELSASAAAAADADVAAPAAAPPHDTEHDSGLAPQDARVPGDAGPLTAAAPVVVDAPKDPLGSLPDTAETTETVATPFTINTDLSRGDSDAATLGDAIIPTKPGGADLEDVLDDATKDVVSRAPARTHEGLVNQLDMKWAELKHFVSTVTGDIDGELGDVLSFVRAKL